MMLKEVLRGSNMNYTGSKHIWAANWKFNMNSFSNLFELDIVNIQQNIIEFSIWIVIQTFLSCPRWISEKRSSAGALSSPSSSISSWLSASLWRFWNEYDNHINIDDDDNDEDYLGSILSNLLENRRLFVPIWSKRTRCPWFRQNTLQHIKMNSWFVQ